MITPKSMPNHPIKPANEDPLKKELEEAFGITLVTPGEQPQAAKKPFVRKPHLTDRPFRDNEGLLALKKQLTPNVPDKKRPAKPNTNVNKKK